MQIVIEIPNSEIPKKQDIIEIPLHFIDGTICEAGGYGFDVLPKGHGRLIDADKVENITWQEPYYHDALNVLSEVRDKVRELPTIIEADKEQEEWIKQ